MPYRDKYEDLTLCMSRWHHCRAIEKQWSCVHILGRSEGGGRQANASVRRARQTRLSKSSLRGWMVTETQAAQSCRDHDATVVVVWRAENDYHRRWSMCVLALRQG